MSNERELREELVLTERLLADRERPLLAIPPCPMHGVCVPHALEWIKSATKAKADAERYRFLRDKAWGQNGALALLPSDQMDAAVDAAMAKDAG